jgi:hypothetical protein
VLAEGVDGSVVEAFSPDFHLPDFGRYIEVTTLRQDLVTRKNRKIRRLRERYPGIDIRVVYQRDYLHLLVRYGLEAPSQLAPVDLVAPANETGDGLLGLGPMAPHHPASPVFRHAG